MAMRYANVNVLKYITHFPRELYLYKTSLTFSCSHLLTITIYHHGNLSPKNPTDPNNPNYPNKPNKLNKPDKPNKSYNPNNPNNSNNPNSPPSQLRFASINSQYLNNMSAIADNHF
jgi:hypothetical protein